MEQEENMAKQNNMEYGNESISALRGADRVRKRIDILFDYKYRKPDNKLYSELYWSR